MVCNSASCVTIERTSLKPSNTMAWRTEDTGTPRRMIELLATLTRRAAMAGSREISRSSSSTEQLPDSVSARTRITTSGSEGSTSWLAAIAASSRRSSSLARCFMSISLLLAVRPCDQPTALHTGRVAALSDYYTDRRSLRSLISSNGEAFSSSDKAKPAHLQEERGNGVSKQLCKHTLHELAIRPGFGKGTHVSQVARKSLS